VCITGVKSVASLGKIVALGYASCDNSSPLGCKVALYSLDAQITTVQRRLSECQITESPIIRIGPKRNIKINSK
jgi:hypothetical protein